jgi:predicted enzyme related to lactoylglutathione lyase
MVEPPEDTELPVLFFTEVPETKVVKNRLHLDLQAAGDLETEVARLEVLGAVIRNWSEEDGGVWCVMLDPEGNEFCVMPSVDDVA